MSESIFQFFSQPSPSDDAEGQSLQIVKYPAQFRVLDDLREFVGQQAETCGLDEKASYAVQLAVDEAFTNIIEHAYGGECDKTIECICQCTPDCLVVTLVDCGNPFNPNDIPEPDLVSDLEDRQVGGLGLYFMRQMMDEVSFRVVPAAGKNTECNLLQMIKRKENVG
jgi:anti-sigma regulatory factor (Ser/Thr protein kinase)